MNYVPKERLYKMTNSTVINLLNHNDIMNQIGKTLQDDFFVIPSSVHEVLLLKASDTDCMELDRKSVV